jgi:hypothetical protein
MAKKAKLKAVAYGSDGLAGDSAFYPSEQGAIPASKDSTFDQLLDRWKAWKMEDEGLEEEDMLDEEMPVGFWLLTEDDLEKALIPTEIECWNDGQTYTVNRAVKTLCAGMAKDTVGTLPKDD